MSLWCSYEQHTSEMWQGPPTTVAIAFFYGVKPNRLRLMFHNILYSLSFLYFQFQIFI